MVMPYKQHQLPMRWWCKCCLTKGWTSMFREVVLQAAADSGSRCCSMKGRTSMLKENYSIWQCPTSSIAKRSREGGANDTWMTTPLKILSGCSSLLSTNFQYATLNPPRRRLPKCRVSFVVGDNDTCIRN
jgi:hypothetical protein